MSSMTSINSSSPPTHSSPTPPTTPISIHLPSSFSLLITPTTDLWLLSPFDCSSERRTIAHYPLPVPFSILHSIKPSPSFSPGNTKIDPLGTPTTEPRMPSINHLITLPPPPASTSLPLPRRDHPAIKIFVPWPYYVATAWVREEDEEQKGVCLRMEESGRRRIEVRVEWGLAVEVVMEGARMEYVRDGEMLRGLEIGRDEGWPVEERKAMRWNEGVKEEVLEVEIYRMGARR